MTPSARTDFPPDQLDSVAWKFLNSELTGATYADWPIDRRIDVFLKRYGFREVLDDGTAYEALLERVMANMGRARRCGTLPSPTGEVTI